MFMETKLIFPANGALRIPLRAFSNDLTGDVNVNFAIGPAYTVDSTEVSAALSCPATSS